MRISVKDIDFSDFETEDVMNLSLQRSGQLDIRRETKLWCRGEDEPLRKFATEKRDFIFGTTFNEILGNYSKYKPHIAGIAPKRVADIGAGYGFIDLLLYKDFGCDLTLIDIETTPFRRFSFYKHASGYTNLETAQKFLIKNGVPKKAIHTINPEKSDIKKIQSVDFAISLFSCGFHYPLSTYDDFFRNQVNPKGGISVSLRRDVPAMDYLKQFGPLTITEEGPKYHNVFVRKTGAA